MSLLSHLTIDELTPLLQSVQRSLTVHSHYELFHWLQEDVQSFLPHDVMIAVWGDFTQGEVCHDVVSSLKGVRTDTFDDKRVQPLASMLFAQWVGCGHTPFCIDRSDNVGLDALDDETTAHALGKMQTGLVHGFKDQRGRHDCLYLLLGPDKLGTAKARDALRFLLPYIDTAFRQVAHLPEQYYDRSRAGGGAVLDDTFDTTVPLCGLSEREMEIMEWVRLGKTNLEIGSILEISAFTVKNHMQRIFKKLDVLNRAQAVAKVELHRHQIAR
ncbi:hypothetical protein GCM10022279_01930 [Comamonas faecalis]|uniref:HTH luxR-type domain-containing protein n=1 Tax=Comamonas faecalis TaxID=1387849 RepID=A0ABP7QG00_9BURK